MKNYYCVNGWISSLPENREIILDILIQVSFYMEELEDCLIYSIGINEEDNTKIYIYEVWKNQNSHKKSLEIEIFREFINKAKPYITGMGDFPSLVIKGGKGIK